MALRIFSIKKCQADFLIKGTFCCQNCGHRAMVRFFVHGEGAALNLVLVASNSARRQAVSIAKEAAKREAHAIMGLVACPECQARDPEAFRLYERAVHMASFKALAAGVVVFLIVRFFLPAQIQPLVRSAMALIAGVLSAALLRWLARATLIGLSKRALNVLIDELPTELAQTASERQLRFELLEVIEPVADAFGEMPNWRQTTEEAERWSGSCPHCGHTGDFKTSGSIRICLQCSRSFVPGEVGETSAT